jgi:hypothetical protein
VGLAVLMSLLALLGCSRGVGRVSATWATLEKSMLAKVADLRAQQADLNAAVKALPPVALTDTTGRRLLARLESAQRVHEGLLAGLDSTMRGARTAVQEAVRTGTVGNSPKALADAQAAFDANLVLLKRSGAAVAADTRQLESYLSRGFDGGQETLDSGASHPAERR